MAEYCSWCEEEILEDDETEYSDSGKICCCGECALFQDEEDAQNELEWDDD